VPPGDNAFFQTGKESVVAPQARKGSPEQSDGVAAHKLYKADSVWNTLGFGVRAIQHFARLLESRLVTEGFPKIGEVVVDGLRYADDGERHSPPLRLGGDGVGASLRAVAAHREQQIDAHAFQKVHHYGWVFRTSGRSPQRCHQVCGWIRRTPELAARLETHGPG